MIHVLIHRTTTPGAPTRPLGVYIGTDYWAYRHQRAIWWNPGTPVVRHAPALVTMFIVLGLSPGQVDLRLLMLPSPLYSVGFFFFIDCLID